MEEREEGNGAGEGTFREGLDLPRDPQVPIATPLTGSDRVAIDGE